MKLDCIIIDDEPRAIEIMKEYVEKIATLSLMETFRNPLKAFDYLKQNKVDLIFLDINMPNLSGIQLIKSLTNKPFIVLTTAYSEYAVESYQLDVVDYLLKPIEFDRFMKCIDKIYDKIKNIDQPANKSSAAIGANEVSSIQKGYIFVKNGAIIERIDLNDILYIEGSGNYIVYQLNTKKIMTLGKMSEMLHILPKNQFARIHKSHIVQLNKIKTIEDNRVLIGDVKLSISNTYRTQFYIKINSKN